MRIINRLILISSAIPYLLTIMVFICILLNKADVFAISRGSLTTIKDTWYRDFTLILYSITFLFILISTTLVIIGLLQKKLKLINWDILFYAAGLLIYFIFIYLDYFNFIEWLVGD